ncbi:hypothetical protein HUO13_11610 [Saccharopolyspora erythraea]|uniref:DUF6286 domain-containing protein n=1 Tax=Saccharopolyspora erythraea TaxID=1836 RepID=UPI001BAA68BD|nr:DUF6286 domain-containing protein [Saccharopolyspora erythraea]QUH01364.1 hypothetical protein HUO13_11610 [Saccharopolyspora erythraea]
MRVLVRLIAALFGLALAAAGALLVAETAWAWLRPDSGGLILPLPELRSALSALTWDQTPVRVTAALVAVAGLVLLLLAFGAGRKDIRLHDPAPEVTVTTDPRSLARLVGHHVRAQDGVAGATVTADRRKVRVRATAQFRQTAELLDELTETARTTVHELPLRRTPKVTVSLSAARERR